MLAEKLCAIAEPLSRDLTIQDIRIGLGYCCVELSDGSAGLAWTPGRQAASCTHLKGAGSLIGMKAKDLLPWLAGEAYLERAIGLAVFNAVNSKVQRIFKQEEAVSLLELTAEDHVVMVGYFAPIIPRIKKIGCRLEIIELDRQKPGTIEVIEGDYALSQCDVAIITSTSIINNTVDGLLGRLKKNRSAVMLGPSTPLCSQAFEGTRITQLSGALVSCAKQVKNIVSQGGGTMLLKKHLQFVTEEIRPA
jgi:uncharacterized protein